MDDKSLYSGLIRLHILHHAAQKPLYGIWIAAELARRVQCSTQLAVAFGPAKW